MQQNTACFIRQIKTNNMTYAETTVARKRQLQQRKVVIQKGDY